MHQLDQMISDAKPVPLTNHVRFAKDQAYDVLDRMRATVADEVQRGGRPSDDVLVAIDSIDDLIHNAKPVPLTDQVRAEREELDATVRTLRDAIARGNRPSPTN
jgi:hypothetical protein